MNFRTIECNGPFNLTVYIDEKDEPWFHVKEVCSFLAIKQPSVAIKPLDEDEKVLTGLSVKADDIEAANALEATLQEIGVNSNRVRVSHPIRRRGHPAWFVQHVGFSNAHIELVFSFFMRIL